MTDLPASWFYLMFVGAFGTCLAQALYRRDLAWALAFGIPLLFSSELASVPMHWVAWGLLLWFGIAVLFVTGAIARWLGASPVMGLAAAGTIALLAGPVNAAQVRGLSLGHPPAEAVHVEEMLRTLVVPGLR